MTLPARLRDTAAVKPPHPRRGWCFGPEGQFNGKETLNKNASTKTQTPVQKDRRTRVEKPATVCHDGANNRGRLHVPAGGSQHRSLSALRLPIELCKDQGYLTRPSVDTPTILRGVTGLGSVTRGHNARHSSHSRVRHTHLLKTQALCWRPEAARPNPCPPGRSRRQCAPCMPCRGHVNLSCYSPHTHTCTHVHSRFWNAAPPDSGR